jgi:hypothetical protein
MSLKNGLRARLGSDDTVSFIIQTMKIQKQSTQLFPVRLFSEQIFIVNFTHIMQNPHKNNFEPYFLFRSCKESHDFCFSLQSKLTIDSYLVPSIFGAVHTTLSMTVTLYDNFKQHNHKT